MRLYLLRHAEASYDAPSDSERELTPKGEKSIEKLCGLLKPKEFGDLLAVHHSTLLRAKQTAQLFREGLGLSIPQIEIAGLAPENDPLALLSFLHGSDKDLMIVGHNPHLSILTAWLLTGNPSADCIDFKKSGLLCLERGSGPSFRRPAGVWVLSWFLTNNPVSN
ncbi:phosphohistidine phosphatase SixA [Cerasicoccus arenae]|uniref:Phosphohistidine phosphatase SixA n=1 Tax=Cerasicoccus arenae TaxID=424488 RepID=A0A8J3GDE6_9BACT|nr:phosphohistidine phosphatase SixA [Cerasicoccus arenae]MBK1858195.1 phosphohistidine phosphatase SixA [Cerasicoccus arenae]GHC00914.1 hypothetical protein GCM10007047_16580 [Cerasicoccus arenae]